MLARSLYDIGADCSFNACRNRQTTEAESYGRTDKTVLERLRIQIVGRSNLQIQIGSK